jgi:hypothetical protein
LDFVTEIAEIMRKKEMIDQVKLLMITATYLILKICIRENILIND